MILAPLVLACPLAAMAIAALIVLAVSLGLAALYIQLFPRRAGRKNADGPGLCGKCGYAVRGISTFQCPECGADLREVGIVPEIAPPPGRRRLWITTGVIFAALLLPCCVCGGLLSFFGRWNTMPPTVTTTTTTTLTTTTPSGTTFTRTIVTGKGPGTATRPAPPPAPSAPASQPADDE